MKFNINRFIKRDPKTPIAHRQMMLHQNKKSITYNTGIGEMLFTRKELIDLSKKCLSTLSEYDKCNISDSDVEKINNYEFHYNMGSAIGAGMNNKYYAEHEDVMNNTFDSRGNYISG